ncbi:MAG: hypothetical protein K0R44_2281, partial [Thermomicrobiales bacterium]|nr:hypothetical protein [Thermomicrobiales bacterium]
MLNQDTGAEAGAWGDGTRFVERGPWATYFSYTVQEPFLCGGDASKCVFVTAEQFSGNLGGLPGADNKCQVEADAAATGGTFAAWLA